MLMSKINNNVRRCNLCDEIAYPGCDPSKSLLCHSFTSNGACLSVAASFKSSRLKPKSRSASQDCPAAAASSMDSNSSPIVVIDVSDDEEQSTGSSGGGSREVDATIESGSEEATTTTTSSSVGGAESVNSQINNLPYQCKLCGLIFNLLEQVKGHYERTHIADKAVMCNLDEEYPNGSNGVELEHITPTLLTNIDYLDITLNQNETFHRHDTPDIGSSSISSTPRDNSPESENRSDPLGPRLLNFTDIPPVSTETNSPPPAAVDEDSTDNTRSRSPSPRFASTEPAILKSLLPNSDNSLPSSATGSEESCWDKVAAAAAAHVVKPTALKAKPKPKEKRRFDLTKMPAVDGFARVRQIIELREKQKQMEIPPAESSPGGDNNTPSEAPPAGRKKPRKCGRPRKNPIVCEKPAALFGGPGAVTPLKLQRSPFKNTPKEPAKELIPVDKIMANEWFTSPVHFKNPYYPQKGDEVALYPHAYKSFIANVDCNAKTYMTTKFLEESSILLKNASLDHVEGIVEEISYKVKGPTYILIMTLKLSTPMGGRSTVPVLWCNKPSPDYVLLKCFHVAGKWFVGDRFRTLVNNAWWLGEIVNFKPAKKGVLFQCFEVRWDSDSTELLSPWDMEKVDSLRKPKKANAGVPLYMDELHLLAYKPTPGEWTPSGREADCDKLMDAIETLMGMKIAQVSDDLAKFYKQTKSTYPISLQIMLERLKYRFYRRHAAILHDLEHLRDNFKAAFAADESKSAKASSLVTLLKHYTENLATRDFKTLCQAALNADDLKPFKNSVEPPRERSPPPVVHSKKKRKERISETPPRALMMVWEEDCEALLKKVAGEDFAEPFLNPVDKSMYSDYYDIITHPMDLNLIKSRLLNKEYNSPNDVLQDIRQLVANSRRYNPRKTTPIYKYTTCLDHCLSEGLKKIIDNYNTLLRHEKKLNTKYSENLITKIL